MLWTWATPVCSLRSEHLQPCRCRAALPHGALVSLRLSIEDRLQYQRLVVLLVPRAVHQGHGVLLTLLLQKLQGILFSFEFLPVACLKLLPFGWIVAEPLAQFRARSHILEPQVHSRTLLGQAAWPEPIDEH